MKGEEQYLYDAGVRAANGVFCGVDEAGRGPLCGPVCCAAVVLDPADPIEGINDSKRLSEAKREALYDQITARAVCWKAVLIGPDIIDEKNILQATMEGMRQAVAGLGVQPQFALIDGNRCPQGLGLPCRSLVRGDALSASIGAASIIAKVTRDRYMVALGRQYPQYQLEKHKGYGTRLHYELLAKHGIAPFYRRSFLKKWLAKQAAEAAAQPGDAQTAADAAVPMPNAPLAPQAALYGAHADAKTER